MISSTFGAPLGGTMRAGQYGLDCCAVSPILPSNFGGGAGSWSPWIVVVALGEPGTPVTCCAMAGTAASMTAASRATVVNRMALVFICLLLSPMSPSAWGGQVAAAL